MKRIALAAALPFVLVPLQANAQAVPFWPGGYGYTLDEVWSYTPSGDEYFKYQGLGASSTKVFADRVSQDGSTVRYDVLDASSGKWVTDQTFKDGYKSSLICGRTSGFTAAGGMFNGIQFRPEGAGTANGWALSMNENAGYQTTVALKSYLRSTVDTMGCEGDSIYPAYCSQSFNQASGALSDGGTGECYLEKYDSISGTNQWSAKWHAGDYATVGSVLVTPGAIYVAGVANNIDGTHTNDKTMHPYVVKLGKNGDVYFTRLYTQFSVDSQVKGKNVLGQNTNGGVFMVVAGTVAKIDEANGDIVKSFGLSGASTGSVVAIPQGSDFMLIPYDTPSQPKVFDVDGNVIQISFSNPAYTRNIVQLVVNPANANQVYAITPNSVGLLTLRKSALADGNAGYAPSSSSKATATSTGTASSAVATTKTTTKAASTTVAAASTTSAAPATTAAATSPAGNTVSTTSKAPSSAGFREAPLALVSTLLALLVALLTL